MTVDNNKRLSAESFFNKLKAGFQEWETETNRASAQLLNEACKPLFENTGKTILMFEMETPIFNDGEECVNSLSSLVVTSEDELLNLVNEMNSERCLNIEVMEKVTPAFLRTYPHVRKIFQEIDYGNQLMLTGFHSDVKEIFESMFHTNVFVMVFKDENEQPIIQRFQPEY